MSEEMKVWLENNNCVLDPVAQSGTRHTEFRAMNVQHQILRDAIHRVDDAAKEHELPLTGEEVVSIAVWILNSGYSGFLPRYACSRPHSTRSFAHTELDC